MKNSLIVFAINLIYNKFINNIDQNLYTCGLFRELPKAFDMVDQNIFLNKLYHNFEICSKPLNLLTSYINNRYLYTNVHNFMSSYRKVSSEVPQGSCLKLLLFFWGASMISS